MFKTASNVLRTVSFVPYALNHIISHLTNRFAFHAFQIVKTAAIINVLAVKLDLCCFLTQMGRKNVLNVLIHALNAT